MVMFGISVFAEPLIKMNTRLNVKIVKIAPNNIELQWQEWRIDEFRVKKLVDFHEAYGEDGLKEAINKMNINLNKWNSREYQTIHLDELTKRKDELNTVPKIKREDETDKDFIQRTTKLDNEIQFHTDKIDLYTDDRKFEDRKTQMIKKYTDKLTELQNLKTELEKK